MIDVIKRLAELDSTNPRVISDVPVLNKEKVSESQIEECGMMPEMGMAPERPSTPASINMTAGSADELGNLLKDIVSLAGMGGHDHDADMVEPAGDMDMPPPAEPEMGPSQSAADVMRSTIDKLNPMDGDDEQGPEDDEADDEEKTNEYDNEPSDPNNPPPFDSNKMSNQDPAGHPGAGDRMDGDRPKAFATFEDQLMYEYKKYVKG